MTNNMLKTVYSGRVSVTVWNNKTTVEGKEREFTTYTIQKSYQDKEGAWQNTNNLSQEDVLRVIPLLQQLSFEIGGERSGSAQQ